MNVCKEKKQLKLQENGGSKINFILLKKKKRIPLFPTLSVKSLDANPKRLESSSKSIQTQQKEEIEKSSNIIRKRTINSAFAQHN